MCTHFLCYNVSVTFSAINLRAVWNIGLSVTEPKVLFCLFLKLFLRPVRFPTGAFTFEVEKSFDICCDSVSIRRHKWMKELQDDRLNGGDGESLCFWTDETRWWEHPPDNESRKLWVSVWQRGMRSKLQAWASCLKLAGALVTWKPLTSPKQSL